MQHSESIVELLTALCAARLEFEVIPRNRQGFSKRGGQKYGYADLNAIIDATASGLAEHGLTMMQFLEDGPERTQTTVKSMLFHLSGQWISSHLTVDHPNDPQEFGIITTYAKRYMQQAMLNLSTEGDDQDGALPEDAAPNRRPREQKRPSPEPVAIPPVGEPERQPSTISVDEMRSLSQLAQGAGLDREQFGDDMRLLLGLEPGAKLTRKFLCEKMTREQYEERRTRYTDLIAAQMTDDTSHQNGTPSIMQPPSDTQASGEGDSGSDAPESSSEASSGTVEAPVIDRPFVDTLHQVTDVSTAAPVQTSEWQSVSGNASLAEDAEIPTTLEGGATKAQWGSLSLRAQRVGLSEATWETMRHGSYDDARDQIDAIAEAKAGPQRELS